MTTINRRLLSAAAAAALWAWTAPAFAQAWPSAKPITIIVPFPPGGTTDVVTRMVAQEISQAIGQTIVVENRAGANGNVGSAMAAKAAPDGYTFLATGVGSNAINHGIYRNMPYDSSKDFSHVTQMTNGPNVLIVNKDFPAQTLKDLIDILKANPGKYNYASSGNGASGHMAMELLKQKAGIQVNHVPYRGGAPAMNDVISGTVPMMFINQDMAFAQAKGGTVRMLGVTSLERNPAEPQVPTIAEQGFPGFSAITWNGLAAPVGTPKEIVDRMQAEALKALNKPANKDKLLQQGFVIGGNSPADQLKFVADEMAKWKQVADQAGVKVD
ncbi:MAG: Bug family tripartite tricarboxylate transporter substrate binding protein [Beijerinckiaceae bacterium]